MNRRSDYRTVKAGSCRGEQGMMEARMTGVAVDKAEKYPGGSQR